MPNPIDNRSDLSRVRSMGDINQEVSEVVRSIEYTRIRQSVVRSPRKIEVVVGGEIVLGQGELELPYYHYWTRSGTQRRVERVWYNAILKPGKHKYYPYQQVRIMGHNIRQDGSVGARKFDEDISEGREAFPVFVRQVEAIVNDHVAVEQERLDEMVSRYE